jgi:hypothetical protein
MKTIYDYETLWRSMLQLDGKTPLLEAFRGVDVVRWHSQIERSLLDFIEKYEGARNSAYTDKLREYLKQWRGHRLDGSINRETVELLLAPTEILSVDNWSLDRFFMGVADGLRVLIASEEELPRMPTDNAKPPGKPGKAAADFGPEKSPGDLSGDQTPGGIDAAVDAGVKQSSQALKP